MALQAPWPHFPSSSCYVKLFNDRKCPVELYNETIPSGQAFNEHFLTQHTDLSMDIDSLFDTICLCSEELFTIYIATAFLHCIIVYPVLGSKMNFGLDCTFVYIY